MGVTFFTSLDDELADGDGAVGGDADEIGASGQVVEWQGGRAVE